MTHLLFSHDSLLNFFGRPPYCPTSLLSICLWAPFSFSPPSEQSSLSIPPTMMNTFLHKLTEKHAEIKACVNPPMNTALLLLCA